MSNQDETPQPSNERVKKVIRQSVEEATAEAGGEEAYRHEISEIADSPNFPDLPSSPKE